MSGKKHILLSVFASLLAVLNYQLQASSMLPESLNQRIHSHLIISDYPSAISEAWNGIQQYPDSKLVWIAYLHAVAKMGDEKRMISHWKLFSERFPEERENRELLESFAWAVIEKGSHASSPAIRVTALLGAFFSQDAKGVVILRRGLSDDNSFLRAAAVKLSSHLPDASLQDELLRLLETEKVWKVRMEVIRAIGDLRIGDAKDRLKKMIGQEHCHTEEKAAAVETLVSLCEHIQPHQISQLVDSNRSGMRMLACELVSFFDQKQDIDRLSPLLHDHHSDVRAKVFQTIGRLRATSIGGTLVEDASEKGAHDPDSTVAITAAWALTINNPEKGMAAFEKFFRLDSRDVRCSAAAALAATGKYGLPLARQMFHKSSDIYVKMNLAIGLIGQRTDVNNACSCLFDGLSEKKEKWAWDEEENFRVLAPSKVKHDDAIPNYPEAVNQLTRLEVLQILAMVKYPFAQQAIKSFLKESQWGISGLASILLLTEGDEEAVDLVQNLLDDNDPKVKVQAALILALWGKGEDVVPLLEETYASADRELREKILEGIGRVGSANSLSFLAEKLQEPYQTLRITAAAALLECLYH